MIRRIVRNVLRSLGYELVRLRNSAETPDSVPAPLYPPARKEIDSLRRDLDRFFARVNALGSPDRSWQGYDTAEMLGYLSPDRLSFYRELLVLCSERGIDFSGRAVADVGTYLGYFPRMILADGNGCRVTGFDLDERSLGLARHLCPECDFVFFDPLYDPGPYAGKFDIVFCTEVLEHLTEPEQSLASLVRLLSPGGIMVLTVPDGRNDQSEAGDIRDETRPDTSYSGHINFWSPESWPRFLRANVPGEIETGQLSSGENFAVIRI